LEWTQALRGQNKLSEAILQLTAAPPMMENGNDLWRMLLELLYQQEDQDEIKAFVSKLMQRFDGNRLQVFSLVRETQKWKDPKRSLDILSKLFYESGQQVNVPLEKAVLEAASHAQLKNFNPLLSLIETHIKELGLSSTHVRSIAMGLLHPKVRTVFIQKLSSMEPSLLWKQSALSITFAKALLLQEDKPRALQFLKAAHQAHPSNASLHFGLIHLLMYAKEHALAIREARLFLQRNPRSVEGHHLLGYLLLERSSHFSEAEDHLMIALGQRPADANIIDSVGWLRFKMGNISEAKRVLTIAHYLLPHDPVVLSHVAALAAHERNTQRSQELFELALSLCQDELQKMQIKQLMDHVLRPSPGEKAP